MLSRGKGLPLGGERCVSLGAMPFVLMCFVVGLCTALPLRAARNILLLIADDYGNDSSSLYNTTGAGVTLPPTPALNALAAGGVRFTNAYACPVCSPTRACILTGRYGFRTGVGDTVEPGSTNQLSGSETTLPEVFAAQPTAGYALAAFGKWHLASGATSPNSIGGWPHFAGTIPGALQSYTNYAKIVNGVQTAGYSVYATTDVVNDAVAWISARGSSPWIAWVAFNAPHTPFHVPPTNLHSYGSNPATNRLKYEAAVEAMDTEIARLLLAVNRAETDIIFMGDNGTPSQVVQSPYAAGKAKDTLYEGGVRVPLIINGPSVVSPGRIATQLVHAVDLFATILDLTDIAAPSSLTLDSLSLLPVLQNQAVTRSRVYTEFFNTTTPASGGRVLRDERYKLILNESGTEEFYDLTNDPTETANLTAAGLSATQLAYRDRLRFEIGRHSTLVAPSVTAADNAAGSGFAVTLPVLANSVSSLWRCTDLAGGFWSPVPGATTAAAGGSITFTDPVPPTGMAFYSVLHEQP